MRTWEHKSFCTKQKHKMKMFGRTGSMTFPMSYDFQGEYFDCARKGWKGLSSLEKALSVSLGITSAISILLMIAVVVVGLQSNDDCQVAITSTVVPTMPISHTEPTVPLDRCANKPRDRPERRESTTESVFNKNFSNPVDAEEEESLSSLPVSQWTPSSDCIVSDQTNNSTICLAPQCFRVASRIIDSIDFSVDPCENFYNFACGNWIKNNPIPEYTQKWSRKNLDSEKVLREIRDILEMDQSKDDSTSLQLAKRFYHSCQHLPDDEVNIAEMKLFLEEMTSVDDQEIPDSVSTLPILLGNVRRLLNGNYIVSLKVDANYQNTMENAIYLDEPVSGLQFLLNEMNIEIPVEGSHHEDEESLKNHQTYRGLAKKLWFLIHPEDDALRVEKVLDDIFSFEKNLTKILSNFTELESEGPINFYNLREIDDVELSQSMISWLSAFVDSVIQDNHKINQSESQGTPNVIVKNIQYFRKLEVLLNETEKEVIENYIKLRILLSFGLHGSQGFRRIFEWFRQTIIANELPTPRWKTCSSLTNQFFGWVVSQKFLTVFDEIAKIQLNLTMNYLKDAFNESLAGSEWLANDETREYAQNKIQLLQTFLGFPDSWHDETSHNSANNFVEDYYLDMRFTDASNYFQNYIEATVWASKKALLEIYELTQRGTFMNEWPKFIHPTSLLSYYSENQNYLVLPAGVMDNSVPLMDSTFPSLHYGSLGVTLAKTMLPSITGNGMFRETDGSFGQWADNETILNYKNTSKCFESQLGKDKIPQESLLQQSILYTGALSLAYEAYHSQTFNREFDEVLLPGLQDYTPEQLFFLSFAQSQCSHEARASVQGHMNSGRSHRTLLENSLSNSVHFAKHWNCPLPEESTVCKVL